MTGSAAQLAQQMCFSTKKLFERNFMSSPESPTTFLSKQSDRLLTE